MTVVIASNYLSKYFGVQIVFSLYNRIDIDGLRNNTTSTVYSPKIIQNFQIVKISEQPLCSVRIQMSCICARK